MNVVLISGAQGSGKTTLLKGLADALIADKIITMPMKFADPIYLMHDAVYNVLGQFGIGKPATKDGELLQLLGTDWGRKKFGPYIWASIAETRSKQFEALLQKTYEEQGVLEQVKDFTRVVVLDDCRYPEELDIFKNQAVTIRLECPAEVRKTRAEYWRENTKHSSEISLDEYAAQGKFDLTIDTQRKTQQETLTLAVEAIRKHVCRNSTGSSEVAPGKGTKN